LSKKKITGKSVFLKPNWVNHNRSPKDEICLVTHESFTIAFLEVILKRKPSNVVIGDAPIQGCNWGKLLSTHFYERVKHLASAYQIPVSIKDLRRVTMTFSDGAKHTSKKPLDGFLIFDTGTHSYLEPITKPGKNRFRVTHYNPDRFNESHLKGMHKYCITKEFLNADIVISMPKTKTHEKTGITNALKNIVGLNGDKDFLPHHQIGGTEKGGDSYPGNNNLRHWSELCYDNANRNIGKPTYMFWIRLGSLLWKVSRPGPMDKIGAGWHGNDTTWRMVMDLNKIAIYGTRDGTISYQPQRILYSLCDAIIGGQGDGPLFPKPLPLGIVCFANNSAWADCCMATLMGMDTQKLPLIKAAVASSINRVVDITLNGKKVNIADLSNLAIPAIMPSGWINYRK